MASSKWSSPISTRLLVLRGCLTMLLLPSLPDSAEVAAGRGGMGKGSVMQMMGMMKKMAVGKDFASV